MSFSFLEKAQEMGLTPFPDNSECFYYSDDFSSVVYKTIYTVDNYRLPHISLHTGPDFENIKYRVVLSKDYKFKGNRILVDQITNSVDKSGLNIFEENHLLSANLSSFLDTIAIENPKNFGDIGNVRPVLDIYNSYNGTRASIVVFGIQINESTSGRKFNCGFMNKFGFLREIHLTNSLTSIAPAIGEFVSTFSENIEEMVESNYTTLDDETIQDTLGFIEKLAGKKRRINISSTIEEINQNRGRLTNWDIFKAISLYTTNERNINLKKLDNMIERVINIPTGLQRLAQRYRS